VLIRQLFDRREQVPERLGCILGVVILLQLADFVASNYDQEMVGVVIMLTVNQVGVAFGFGRDAIILRGYPAEHKLDAPLDDLVHISEHFCELSLMHHAESWRPPGCVLIQHLQGLLPASGGKVSEIFGYYLLVLARAHG